jgi:hypothetical protein
MNGDFAKITGYTYKAENYTPEALISYLIQTRVLAPAARNMDPEEALDQLAETYAIDRDDEWTFDSDDFPKVIGGWMDADPREFVGATEPETPAKNTDYQDCPRVFDDGSECAWSGEVVRDALDEVNTENGYAWTCPQCGADWEWEGPEPDPIDWDGHPDLPVSDEELRRLIAEDERNR